MLMKYFFFLLMLVSLNCQHQGEINVTKPKAFKLSFINTGYIPHKVDHLWKDVSDSLEVSFINTELENLKPIRRPLNPQQILWIIDLHDEKGNELFRVGAFKGGALKCFVDDNFKYYKNDLLFDKIKLLMHVERMKEYDRDLNQRTFDGWTD